MSQVQRRSIEDMQATHPDFGRLYSLLHDVRDIILEVAFQDQLSERFEFQLPLLSLEAMNLNHPAGRWKGRFMELGPLGFGNVISLNMMAFEHAAEIPPCLAHEMCHWMDRPNTGHEDSFWHLMERYIGIDRHGMKSMTWVRLEEYFPMEDLSSIVLNIQEQGTVE